MSVLMKGMEMPKDCIDCFAETYNECMATGKIVNSIGRPDWCPLVEIPPHGRLIDADKLERQTCPIKGVSRLKFCGNCDHKFMYVGEVKTTCDEVRYFFLKTITDAPTIIEAEE